MRFFPNISIKNIRKPHIFSQILGLKSYYKPKKGREFTPCLLLYRYDLLQKLYDTLLFLLLDTTRTMEQHRTIQNHYEVKALLIHNILIDELVFHDIVEDGTI